MRWYKVIVLSIDVFESMIADERHFSSKNEADKYINGLNGYQVGIVVPMGD